MPLNPPKKNKNASAQQFSKNDLDVWQGRLECVQELEEIYALFQDVFRVHTPQCQLASLKKIGAKLCSRSLNPDSVKTVLCVLVELHSRCTSRHPLQRAAASLLQSQSDEHLKATVLEHISITIQTVLSMAPAGSATCHRAIQYIEVLMENFRPGLQALELHLPLILEFCVTTLMSFRDTRQDASNTMNELIALLKTTSTLLLKLSQQLHLMLTLSEEDQSTLKVLWLESFKGCEEKRQWTEHKLALLVKVSEDLLTNTGLIPHDATVSAAMLLVATLNLTLGIHPSMSQDCSPTSLETLVSKLEDYFTSWSPFAQLSLCHALLAKLPLFVMVGVKMRGQLLLVTLFGLITKLSTSFTESSERYISSRTLALWTNVARECTSVMSTELSLYQALLPSEHIMTTLLQYIWSQWEDPIDGIRHQCKEMFENIIKTYKQLQHPGSEDFLLELTRTLLALESPTRGKFVLLSSLSPHVLPNRILQISPELPSQLMTVMGHQALACHAGDLWSRLVAIHWSAVSGREEDECAWSETWIRPLVSTMCNGDELALKHITQHCLPALFQCCDKSLTFASVHLEKSPSNKILTAQLACLHCAKTHLREGLPSTYSLDKLFTSAMYHVDEQVHLSALGLVCESVRTTEPPQLSLLPLLLIFVELNANSQSPGFRYPVLTSFKKLFIRIRDSCYMMCKTFQKTRGLSENPASLMTAYQEFLQALLEQLFSVLHPLSSYQRRNFSLSLLQTMASIFAPDKEEGPSQIESVFEFHRSVSKKQARRLVDGLRDHFDANRLMCLELLYKLEPAKIGVNDPNFVTSCVQSFMTLVCSPKSVDCSSAAFLLRLLTHFSCVEFNSALSLQLSNATPSSEEASLLSTLLLLCQLLRDHTASAKKDLVKASIHAPMYGVLQSLRTVAEAIHWTPSTAAREAIREVLETCIQVSQVVSPVVCSSSPEGFLPNKGEGRTAQEEGSDQIGEEEIHQEGVSEGLGMVGEDDSSGTAQSLLLCCWHSMKEISLLIGYLAGELPVIIEANESGGILTQDQLDQISEVFIHQLTEARHRGAFEMAYTGFCKLCQCLWSSNCPKLSQKPSLWIHDLLDSLQASSLTKLLSITRRSAGLPFYVQAILTSEPSHTGYTCSKYTIQTLLKVARSGLTASLTTPTETESPVQSQPLAVHALNILRSLYRESKLGDFVAPFISEGVMVAIEGFSASLWPVRNSSTLLFSALVSRVFGAKRVQDEHSSENKMTSREFFTRFPTLYDFLLAKLKDGAAQLHTPEHVLLQPSLFSTLLLLSRLYPSPLDDDHSPFTLKPFLVHLLSCTCCPVWKTRVLVSRTLATLTSPTAIFPLLKEMYDGMSLSEQNSLHGSLLVVSILVKERERTLLAKTASGDIPAHWLLRAHLNNSYIASSQNPCGVTAQLYVDILHSLLELCIRTACLPQLPLDRLKTILSYAYNYCFNDSSVTERGLFSSSLCEVYFRLMLLVAQHQVEFSDVTVLGLRDLLCKAVGSDRCLVRLGLKALNSSPLDVNSEEDIAMGLRSRVLQLVSTETDPEILAEAYSFLAKGHTPQDGTEDKLFARAYQLCVRPTNTLELRLSLMHFIRHILRLLPSSSQSSIKFLTDWISHLKTVSVPTQPFEIRIAVAKQLSPLWDLAMLSQPSLSALSMLIVTLLQDSDQDVRIQAAAAVTQILLAGDVIHEVECLNPSQALRLFVTESLTKQVTKELSTDVLLSLVSMLSQKDTTLLSTLNPHTPTSITPSQPTNVLFDEDPINDYAEDLLVLKMVVKSFHEIQPLSVTGASRLVQVLEGLVADIGPQLASGYDSPWENMRQFKVRMKLRVLAPLFELARSGSNWSDALSQCMDTLEELTIS